MIIAWSLIFGWMSGDQMSLNNGRVFCCRRRFIANHLQVWLSENLARFCLQITAVLTILDSLPFPSLNLPKGSFSVFARYLIDISIHFLLLFHSAHVLSELVKVEKKAKKVKTKKLKDLGSSRPSKRLEPQEMTPPWHHGLALTCRTICIWNFIFLGIFSSFCERSDPTKTKGSLGPQIFPKKTKYPPKRSSK